jgi:hypothetical protein
MAGSVKLNCFKTLKTLQDDEAISVDTCSAPIDARGAVDGVVKVSYTGYDGTNGTIKMQVSSDNNADTTQWVDWGGINAQGVMDSATGVCEFHIWQFGPTYIRACVILGDGTTANVTSKFALGYG